MIHTRTKIIAIISLLFLASAVTVYGIFLWVLAGHKEQLAEERRWVAEAASQEQAFSKLEETLAASAADREKLKGFILKDDEIIELLSMIERTAKEENVALSTDSLIVEAKDETFETLIVSLTFQGSFNSVMQIIQILEVLPQQSRISKVELVTTKEDGIQTWQGSVTLKVTKFKKI